jgi:broad specificity phosphatase PhoE
MRTVIHLVRHGRVENPNNTWYGVLEGYHLSELGRRQAEEVGRFFEGRPISAVYASPLARTMETAAPIARALGLEPIPEPDIIESETYLQGKPADRRVFLNPMNLRYFLNPLRPSWGEPYDDIAERMLRGLARMRKAYPGTEIIAVSHMTPIAIARLRVEGDRRPGWMARIPVLHASVTSLEFEGERHVGTEYVDVGARVVKTNPDHRSTG